MKANLAHGRIAGLPATGGYVTLEQADGAALVNAMSGLIREAKGLVAIAGLGALGIFMLGVIAKRKEEEREFEEKSLIEAKIQSILNPQLSLSGLCRVACDNGHRSYIGICLDEEISFKNGSNEYRVPLQQVKSIFVDLLKTNDIERDRLLDFVNLPLKSSVTVVTIDGSRFGGSFLAPSPKFQTIAGIDSPDLGSDVETAGWRSRVDRPDLADRILPVTLEEIAQLRDALVTNMRHTRLDLLEPLGLDLVRKYFHVEMPEPKQPLALPSTTQAVARLEVAIMEISPSQRIATKTLSMGQAWTVAFGDAQVPAEVIFGKVENVAPYSFRLLAQAGYLCIVGKNIQVTSLLVDGKRSTTPLVPVGEEWVLDCRQQSHVVVVNGNCMLHICPRSQ